MSKRKLYIAVALDNLLWYKKFAESLEREIANGNPLSYKIVNLEVHNWLEIVRPFDVVIWKPAYMGPKSANILKEKIFFLEYHLKKIVIPNFATVWHFESKFAQNDIFEFYMIPKPRTVVSYDYHDAIELLQQFTMPVIFKKSHGAGSENIFFMKQRKQAERAINSAFFQQLWNSVKYDKQKRIRSLFSGWFWKKMKQKVLNEERVGSILFQEFIADNDADLRITVIGDRYAYGFWRRNRPDDFRASGSGLIDYKKAIPENIIIYLLNLNKKLDLDSMAYDLLFTKSQSEKFLITEMSYGYDDLALYKAKGYYELQEDNKLYYRQGNVWPQEIWVNWALRKAGAIKD